MENETLGAVAGQAGLHLARQRAGEARVNIATFHLGRSAPGADAIALIEVDQALDDALLARVRAIPGVVQAEALRF